MNFILFFYFSKINKKIILNNYIIKDNIYGSCSSCYRIEKVHKQTYGK